jgi:hypothetical protein
VIHHKTLAETVLLRCEIVGVCYAALVKYLQRYLDKHTLGYNHQQGPREMFNTRRLALNIANWGYQPFLGLKDRGYAGSCNLISKNIPSTRLASRPLADSLPLHGYVS